MNQTEEQATEHPASTAHTSQGHEIKEQLAQSQPEEPRWQLSAVFSRRTKRACGGQLGLELSIIFPYVSNYLKVES